MTPGPEFDVAMFWKQNDSGIYGRRSDLLLADLARSPSVGITAQFDAPLSLQTLTAMSRCGATEHHGLVAEMARRRIAGMADDAWVSRHTFVYDGPTTDDPAGVPLDAFGDFVESKLEQMGFGTRPLVLLVYPTNAHQPAIIDRLRPDLVVSDVVDDNRTWFDPGSVQRAQTDADYRAIADRSDIVVANCEGAAERIRELCSDVELLPNACEMPSWRPGHGAREHSGSPIIGYVGNLSSRIDVPLLEHIAETRSHWTLLLVGSTHGGGEVLSLSSMPNVQIIGPRVYEEAKRLICSFDVAIIPHVDNSMTRAMQPLKAFVYCSLGIPVVATNVAHLPDFGPMITVAETPNAFVEACERSLRRGTTSWGRHELDILRANTWSVRAEQLHRLIDDELTDQRTRLTHAFEASGSA